MNDLNRYFDHTLLSSSADLSQIKLLCSQAKEFQFYSVCVNPFWIPQCIEFLEGTQVKVCTVIGFPLGANTTETKAHECEHVVSLGAQEVDAVINIGALKSGNKNSVLQELKSLKQASQGSLLKVIVESGVLSNEELFMAIDLVNESGADFIKTSTGFAKVGATPEAVQVMSERRRLGLFIKASGGIADKTSALNYISLGADRLGSSKGDLIMKENT